MLVSLKIKNFIIIEKLEASFSKGLTVITGETGAGKSILISSLKLVLGGRASADVVRQGAKEAEIQATFDVSLNKHIQKVLSESDVEVENGELIVRRIINSKGQGKIYINDVTATLTLLTKITPLLLDICSQFENQSLFSPTHQLILLDRYAKTSEESIAFSSIFSQIQKIRKEMKELDAVESEREKRLDYIKYQFSEIDDAAPLVGEENSLTEELDNLSKSKDLFDIIKQIEHSFYGDDNSVISKLETIKIRITKLNLNSLKDYEDKLEQIVSLAEEVSNGLISQKKSTKYNPARINELHDRMEELKKIKRKYGGSLEAAVKKHSELKLEIERLENAEKIKKELKKQHDLLMIQAKKIGLELSEKRVSAASDISSKITKELQDLEMKGAQLKIKVNFDVENLSSTGFDFIEIEFSPNKGERFGLLEKIASGGELSRVTLSIHKILTDGSENKTYIFDEVDSGIGGATGLVVGRKLKEIGSSNQVICITHLGQVAVFGQQHLQLKKKESEDRVSTSITEIETFEKRTAEVARMLGGTQTKDALNHAAELLGSNSK